jgi:hypothetical protein
LVLKREGIEA